MTADVIALRAHLVAEAARKRSRAVVAQRWAATHWQTGYAYAHAEEARRCTDAWLAADARLRALDGLLAASKAQADAVELRRTGAFARGRWHTREETDALMLAPCEGDVCAWRECLPCGLRRLGAADRPWHEHRPWPPTGAT